MKRVLYMLGQVDPETAKEAQNKFRAGCYIAMWVQSRLRRRTAKIATQVGTDVKVNCLHDVRIRNLHFEVIRKKLQSAAMINRHLRMMMAKKEARSLRQLLKATITLQSRARSILVRSDAM